MLIGHRTAPEDKWERDGEVQHRDMQLQLARWRTTLQGKWSQCMCSEEEKALDPGHGWECTFPIWALAASLYLFWSTCHLNVLCAHLFLSFPSYSLHLKCLSSTNFYYLCDVFFLDCCCGHMPTFGYLVSCLLVNLTQARIVWEEPHLEKCLHHIAYRKIYSRFTWSIIDVGGPSLLGQCHPGEGTPGLV